MMPPSPDPFPKGEGELNVKMDAFGGFTAKSIHFYIFLFNEAGDFDGKIVVY
jgi:hypothetical protein